MILSAHRVTVRRGGRELLTQVSTAVSPGTLTAVVGPNGAGKSTFARCLGGELAPCEGRVTLDNRDIGTFPARELAARRAVLPQLSDLDFPFPVLDIVRLGRLPHGDGRRPSGAQAVQRALRAMDLDVIANRSFVQLSGGERQRVHMARVLAQIDGIPSPWLILDEPTSALDLQHQHRLLDEVCRFVNAGGGAMVVLHDLNLALRYADHVLLFDRGRLVSAGPPLEVLVPPILHEVFEVEVRRHLVPQDGALLSVGRYRPKSSAPKFEESRGSAIFLP